MRTRFLALLCTLFICAPLFAANGKDRCGTRQPSDEEIAGIELALKKAGGRGKISVSVPVWIHVITQGAGYENGNLSEAMIRSQIKVLNDSFTGKTGGVGTGFGFDLAGVTVTENAEWFTNIAFDFDLEAIVAVDAEGVEAGEGEVDEAGGFDGEAAAFLVNNGQAAAVARDRCADHHAGNIEMGADQHTADAVFVGNPDDFTGIANNACKHGG